MISKPKKDFVLGKKAKPFGDATLSKPNIMSVVYPFKKRPRWQKEQGFSLLETMLVLSVGGH